MKPIYLVPALLLFSLRAQAPTPVPLARGNVPGEPHHHLKIENEYVRAYYVEVPPHSETQLHQHDNDYIFVALGDSDVTNAVLGKPEVHLALKEGEIHFSRGGFAHVARNNSDAPFRNVTIEFLHPQGEARNLCAKIVDGPTLPCAAEPAKPGRFDLRSIRLLQTQEILVESVTSNSRVPPLALRQSFPRLLVALEGTHLRMGVSGMPPDDIHPGGLMWLLPNVTYELGKPVLFSRIIRYLVISF